jgi:predicted N-acetyltransferase YhbS
MLIELHTGDRAVLRPLFELADDSRAALDGYLGAGRVLVAREAGEIVGHLQLTEVSAEELEIKNMAVVEAQRGHGVGRALIAEALRIARTESRARVCVATAAADVGDLRFYQRCGFRMLSIERDAFTPETGYERDITIDGILLRDRVWLDLAL